MTRGAIFIAGLLLGIVVVVPLGAYLFARLGGIAMATTAHPLPLEKTLPGRRCTRAWGMRRRTGIRWMDNPRLELRCESFRLRRSYLRQTRWSRTIRKA